MMNKTVKTKLAGFTISEIIISLMMSAILIGLVVKLYEYFLEINRANDKALTDFEHVLNFEHLLSKSMAESDSVRFFPENETLAFYKNGLQTFFSFSDSAAVYCNPMPADTFFIKTVGIESVYHTLAPTLPVALNIHLLHSKHTVTLKLIKEYEGATIVKSQLREK